GKQAARPPSPPFRSARAGRACALLVLCAALAAGALGGTAGCNGQPAPSPPGGAADTADGQPSGPGLFRDVTAESGVHFTYRNGEEAGHYAILESLGGGVALIDYDRDGLLDIFLTGGGYFDGPDKKQIKGHPSRLYRNLGNFRFKDVTAEVGLNVTWFYTHGCAVADYDNDV